MKTTRVNPIAAIASLVAATVAAGVFMWRVLFGDVSPPTARGPGVVLAHRATSLADTPMAAHAGPGAALATARGGTVAQGNAHAGSSPLAPTEGGVRSALADFDRLRAMPAGDAAIDLSRSIEDAYTASKAPAYVQTLLGAEHDAVERASAGALARHGDGDVMRSLAGHYGRATEPQRGHILQVFEQASNPQALEGLAEIVAADSSEKRSAMVMSAMVGIANIGTMESVTYLLEQVGVGNPDFALMALERVTSTQGVEMIRAAAQGSKDAAGVPAAFRPSLQRIAAGTSAR